jgi:hypothetical protein
MAKNTATEKQIEENWKNTIFDKYFRSAISNNAMDVLAARITPKVYEYGFLLK